MCCFFAGLFKELESPQEEVLGGINLVHDSPLRRLVMLGYEGSIELPVEVMPPPEGVFQMVGERLAREITAYSLSASNSLDIAGLRKLSGMLTVRDPIIFQTVYNSVATGHYWKFQLAKIMEQGVYSVFLYCKCR